MARRVEELRRNPISGTVVIIGSDREKPLEKLRRQGDRDWSKVNPTLVSGATCPFEEGREGRTPKEVNAYRAKGTKADSPGWWVRVVPNLAPAVNASIPSEILEVERRGPYAVLPAFGFHYVIIESPQHEACLETFESFYFREVLHMWRELTLAVGSNRNIHCIFLFKNYGPLAGASQPHPHSQLMALPMLTTRIHHELAGARHYYDQTRSCFYCDEVEWEIKEKERLVQTSANFMAWCPFTSRTPYQVVVGPRYHQSYFANISTHPQGTDFLSEFTRLLQAVLMRLRVALNDPDYNLYFHTAPTNDPELPTYHWHCQIEPITEAIQAAFEKGSGAYINPRSPESAAEDLRNADLGSAR